MINPKIIEAIESKFNKERFLFWYDTDKDYSNDIKELSITNAKILLIDELPSLNIKLEIAQSDLSQKFLFYSAMPQPEPQNDWLLSYRLKGKSFSADSTQILLDDLGLASHTLRPHLKARIKFLGARERVERLKKWLQPQDNENTIDLKIMTVIARADQADPFEVVNKVLSAVVQDDEVSFDSPSRIWSEFIQYQMEEAFWWLAKQNFGYKSEKPSLKHLFMCLLVTDFANSLDDQSLLPKHLDHFVLADLPTKANAKVFISRWRSDVSLMNPYVHITQAIGNELDVGNLISDMPASSLINVLTFDVVERKLLSDLKKNILSGSDYSNILAIITPRKDGFWANLKVARDFDLTKAYAACYDAIEAASKFFELKKKYELGFSFANAKQGLDLYKTEIFQFDQAYRHFHFSAAQVEPMGWSLLQDLVEHIESNYAGWFIPQFSSAWNKVVEGPDGLLSHWRIVDWTNQFNFYDTYVDSLLKGSVKRVFVLISDAFRFEAAEELSNRLSARNKYQTKLDVMLGVLPSYTSLGMASLLPHKNLKYKLGQNVGILADDLPTAGLDQRTAVLNKYQGVAIKFGDLLTLGKEKGREFIKPFEVVYIYHDHVDAIGDKQATETKTFEAVDQTIEELSQMVSFVFNSLSASTLYITADHGFMYQESALESADKSNLVEKHEGAMVTKKRYIIGSKLGSSTQAWYGNTHITANTVAGESSVDFWVPKGANRFHFTGGARFVHGSAMPQEVVVPVITVKQLESEKGKTKFVDVALLGSINKIVTNMQRFELIQTDPISDYVLPRTLRLSIKDDQSAISDETIITFDKIEKLMDERKQSIILTLKSGDYDRFKEYYFSARDIDSGVEVIRQPIKIDLAFTNDF